MWYASVMRKNLNAKAEAKKKKKKHYLPRNRKSVLNKYFFGNWPSASRILLYGWRKCIFFFKDIFAKVTSLHLQKILMSLNFRNALREVDP